MSFVEIDFRRSFEGQVTSRMAEPRSLDGGVCPVCREEYCEPELLPCGHVVCRSCALSWLKKGGCPLCRTPILTQSGQHQAQDSDHNLTSAVDELPTDQVTADQVRSKQVLTPPHTCHICEDRPPAMSFCFQCDFKLCSSCTKGHQKIPATRDHDVRDLVSLTTEVFTALTRTVCTSHPDRTADLYCVDHRTAICTLCTTTLPHKMCQNVDAIELLGKQERVRLEELLCSLREKEKDLEKAIKCLEGAMAAACVLSADMQKDINRKFDGIVQTVEARREKLLHAILTSERQATSQIRSEKSDLEMQRSVLAVHVQFGERLVAKATDGGVMKVVHQLEARLKKLEMNKWEKLAEIRWEKVNFDQISLDNIQRAVTDLGHLTSFNLVEVSPAPHPGPLLSAASSAPSADVAMVPDITASYTSSPASRQLTAAQSNGSTATLVGMSGFLTLQTLPIKRDETLQTLPIKRDETLQTLAVKRAETLQTLPVKRAETLQTLTVKRDETLQASTVTIAGIVFQTLPSQRAETLQTLPVKTAGTLQTLPVKKTETLQTLPVERAETLQASTVRTAETFQTLPVKRAETFQTLPVKRVEMLQASPVKTAERLQFLPVKTPEILQASPVKTAEALQTFPVKTAEMLQASPVKTAEILQASTVQKAVTAQISPSKKAAVVQIANYPSLPLTTSAAGLQTRLCMPASRATSAASQPASTYSQRFPVTTCAAVPQTETGSSSILVPHALTSQPYTYTQSSPLAPCAVASIIKSTAEVLITNPASQSLQVRSQLSPLASSFKPQCWPQRQAPECGAPVLRYTRTELVALEHSNIHHPDSQLCGKLWNLRIHNDRTKMECLENFPNPKQRKAGSNSHATNAKCNNKRTSRR